MLCVISTSKGRFQTGFARVAPVICFFPPLCFLSPQKPHHVCLPVVLIPAPNLPSTSSSHLCLLTNERRDIFAGIPSSSVAPLGPDPSFLLFREFSLEEVGGSILPSTRPIEAATEADKEIYIFFSSSKAKNQSTAGRAYRRSVQRHSHLTRGLASSIWHQLPRLDKQCLVGILNRLMQLCSAERSTQQSAASRETHTRVAVRVINH